MIRFELAAVRATFRVVAGVFLLLGLTLRTSVAAGPTSSQTLPSISQSLVGGEFDYTVRSHDSLTSISSRFGVSAAAIASLNEITRQSALHPGRILRIDNRHVVPMVLGRGILINIPQRMLFFFEGSRVTKYYPVSVGRPTWPTPVGKFIVVQKRENPTWIVPRSIQLEMERKGKEVLTCVPPGPDNPLGHYALNLSITGYRIHGTIAPLSIYSFATHGCIRLHPDDIADLYKHVGVGEQGEVIYQPVMLADLGNGGIFLEVNRDVYRKGGEPLQSVRALAELANIGERIDWNAAAAIVKEASGIARKVNLPAASGKSPDRGTSGGRQRLYSIPDPTGRKNAER